MSTTGSNSLVLVRRFWPTWVIVVAVVGALLFLVGLLALLIRETETLTISLTSVPEGTRVAVSGVASTEMTSRLRGVLASLEQEPMTASDGQEPFQQDADGGHAGAGSKVCPDCAETVKAAANVCRFCGHRFEPSTEAAQ